MGNPYCARFALATDCEDHADHEIIKYGCAAACQTCEKLLDETDGITKAAAFWFNAIKEYEQSHQVSYSKL
jgi:hypothetical protein